MDATRPRRSRDFPRQRWYARWRSFRFARHLGFTQRDDPTATDIRSNATDRQGPWPTCGQPSQCCPF